MIAEPDVAMTDFALAVEGGWLGGLVYRRGMAGPARRWWAAFFAAVAMGAVLGGISHGFVRRTGAPAALAGVVGLLTLAAGSLVQWWGLGVHPEYLTHNAVYHLFEMLALALLYRAARWLSTTGLRC